jgi:hypothetical protein
VVFFLFRTDWGGKELEERLVRKKASHDLLLLLYFSGLVIDFHGLQHNMNSGPIMGEKKK